MTPEQFMEHVGHLVSEGRNRDALDFIERVEPALRPGLSFDQLDRLGGLLESASTMLSLEQAAQASDPLRLTPAPPTP